jgi:CheY-like chemotaxis protein
VLLAVEDTGPGVPPALREKIFEPFFTTKPVGAGTGLGLALVAEITAAHHGQIRVTSGARGGARFELRFPVVNGPASEKPASVDPPRLVAGRLLLIDDEVLILRLFTNLLSGTCEIVTAGSGAEAVAVLERDRAFDLVLCDLHMPGVDGIKVYEMVQRLEPALLDRFVFTTGGAITPRSREFLGRVKPRVLAKPFPVEELYALIQEMKQRPPV